MATEQQHPDIEFKIFDGLTLRGSLYVGPKGGPAVIVNGAFMCPKEIFVEGIAAWFGRNGLTALVCDYDARTIGTSDGLPRNDLDPQKMGEDNSDAVTFLQKEGWVDLSCIAIWGFFYSSGIALEATAFDKREALVARAVEDQANQLRGDPPEYIPLLNDKGEHLMLFKYLDRMTPENDEIVPPEYQERIFDSMQSPLEKFHVVKNRGHSDFLSVDLDELLIPQLAFLKEALKV